MTLRQNIRRALWQVCEADILGAYSPKPISGSRQSWARLHNLLAILRTGERFNANSISRLMKISSKTIQRDLQFLRRQGVQIIYERGPQTYALDKSFSLPPQFGGKLSRHGIDMTEETV